MNASTDSYRRTGIQPEASNFSAMFTLLFFATASVLFSSHPAHFSDNPEIRTTRRASMQRTFLALQSDPLQTRLELIRQMDRPYSCESLLTFPVEADCVTRQLCQAGITNGTTYSSLANRTSHCCNRT